MDNADKEYAGDRTKHVVVFEANVGRKCHVGIMKGVFERGVLSYMYCVICTM